MSFVCGLQPVRVVAATATETSSTTPAHQRGQQQQQQQSEQSEQQQFGSVEWGEYSQLASSLRDTAADLCAALQAVSPHVRDAHLEREEMGEGRGRERPSFGVLFFFVAFVFISEGGTLCGGDDDVVVFCAYQQHISQHNIIQTRDKATCEKQNAEAMKGLVHSLQHETQRLRGEGGNPPVQPQPQPHPILPTPPPVSSSAEAATTNHVAVVMDE